MLDDLRDPGYGPFATRAPRTRAEPIMHENNGSGLKVRSYTGEHLRNVVPTPIVGISGPGDELESEVLRHGLSTWRDGPPGGAPQAWRRPKFTQGSQAFACIDLDFRAGEFRMPEVLRAMKLHAVPGTDHPVDKVGN